jgi:hypothetical protein
MKIFISVLTKSQRTSLFFYVVDDLLVKYKKKLQRNEEKTDIFINNLKFFQKHESNTWGR